MLLHQQFVRNAKRHSNKLAIKDKTTKSEVSYGRALIGALILSKKFEKYDKGYIGIMIPTSAGCALATVGALMSGRVPVMINYSTGAEQNSRFAQEKCSFKTIITSKALLDKTPNPDREEIREAISGNLCRCTGYVKIVDAIEAVSMAGRQQVGCSPMQPKESTNYE